MRAEQLRELFGLGPREELYGSFMCSHTRHGWGALQLTGMLHVFSTLMVFHAAPFNKVVRLPFKDVKVIRKRSLLRLPNTIAVKRCDERGAWHDDVFTSFVFASRRRAFEAMTARWRATSPAAAEAYLGPEVRRGNSSFCGGSSQDGDAGLVPPHGKQRRHHALQHQQHQPTTPFPCSWEQLQLPAGAELPPPPTDVASGGMTAAASARLPCDTRTFAQVLLADTSGFLPAALAEQGSPPISITPWKLVAGAGAAGSAPCSLVRTFTYRHEALGSWGTISSRVIQRQALHVAADGRLLLETSQTMPDLPAGAGNCFRVVVRWEVAPAAAGSAAAGSSGSSAAAPAAAAPGPPPPSPAAGAAAHEPPGAPLPPPVATAAADEEHEAATAASASTPARPPLPSPFSAAPVQRLVSSGSCGSCDGASTQDTAASSSCLTSPQASSQLSGMRMLQRSFVRSMRGARASFKGLMLLRPAASSPLATLGSPSSGGSSASSSSGGSVAGSARAPRPPAASFSGGAAAASAGAAAPEAAASASKGRAINAPADQGSTSPPDARAAQRDQQQERQGRNASATFGAPPSALDTGPGRDQEAAAAAAVNEGEGGAAGGKQRGQATSSSSSSQQHQDAADQDAASPGMSVAAAAAAVLNSLGRLSPLPQRSLTPADAADAADAASEGEGVSQPAESPRVMPAISIGPLIAPAAAGAGEPLGKASGSSAPVLQQGPALKAPDAAVMIASDTGKQPPQQDTSEQQQQACGPDAASLPVQASGAAVAAAGVEWRVSVGLVWSRWHIAQGTINSNTLAATSRSLQELVQLGSAWVAQLERRLSLAAVMPQHAAGPTCRGSAVQLRLHRRSGSSAGAGSVRQLAGAGPSALARASSLMGAPAGRASSSTSSLTASALAALLGCLCSGGRAGSSLATGAARCIQQQRATLIALLGAGLLLAHTLLLWRAVGLLGRLSAQLEAASAAATPQGAACRDTP